MSHKYYGFQKQNEDNLYTIPFLSTKSQRVRFLNNDFVGYGEQNEFIIHRNPGLTIVRLTDNQLIRDLHNRSNTNNLMVEFLNNLVQSSNNSFATQLNVTSNQLSVKEIKVNSNSAIQISFNAY